MQNNADIIREQLQHISFPDGEILSVLLEDGNANVVIKDWRERKIHLHFNEVALFKSFCFGGDINECVILNESKEIDEAITVLEKDHGIVPENHGFVHISIVNDVPMLTVIFKSLKIEIENQS